MQKYRLRSCWWQRELHMPRPGEAAQSTVRSRLEPRGTRPTSQAEQVGKVRQEAYTGPR